MRTRILTILLGTTLLLGCRTPEEGVDSIAEVIESVQFELPVVLEWAYLLPPEGSSPFVAKLILHNAPPVRPPDPGFPSDYCPSNAKIYSTATGEGAATHIGQFAYSERWCGMPGSRVMADVVFTAEDGDELHATALASAGPTIPAPPFPHATFTGTYTITGGTGRFRGARGKASIAGQQLGHQREPDMPAEIPGSTAIGLAGWINLQSSDTSQVEVIKAQHLEVWSKGRVELIDQLYTSEFVGHFPSGIVRGREGIRERVLAHRIAFPDWTEEIDDTIVDGDRVVTRFTSRGTNEGEFLGNPATGKRVEISEAAIFRFSDGRIAEQWVYPNILSMQQQLRK